MPHLRAVYSFTWCADSWRRSFVSPIWHSKEPEIPHLRSGTISTELCKNIRAKFRESPSKCSAGQPKNALWCNISASHSRNLAGMFFTLLCMFLLFGKYNYDLNTHSPPRTWQSSTRSSSISYGPTWRLGSSCPSALLIVGGDGGTAAGEKEIRGGTIPQK